VIERALAQCPDDRGNSLRAFRSVQLAMAARPAAVSTALDSLDRSKLAVLPALVAIWAEVIALGDLGYPQRAAAAAATGLELACGSTDAIYEGIGLTEFHVAALLLGGCIGQAVAAAQHTYEKFMNLPGRARSAATAISGMAALGAGDLPTALRCLRSAVADFEAYSDTTGALYRFVIVYTQALARSGTIDGALNWMGRMQGVAHPSCVFVESDRLLSTAWVAAARGRTTEAREIAVAAADFAASHGQPAREVICLQAAVQFGETKIATRLEELARRLHTPRAPLAARYAHALANDDGDELCIVSSDFEELGDRFAAADAAAHASVAYGQQNRRGAALSAGARARRIMAACGGAVSPAVLAAQSPLPLTAREREIGTMVAQGLANKEIAQALTMSVRTVEGHIYRVTSKLDVANRTELSSLMRECGDVPAEPHIDVVFSTAEPVVASVEP
jgi:DNA-binding CsgD family transcriptional regulator